MRRSNSTMLSHMKFRKWLEPAPMTTWCPLKQHASWTSCHLHGNEEYSSFQNLALLLIIFFSQVYLLQYFQIFSNGKNTLLTWRVINLIYVQLRAGQFSGTCSMSVSDFWSCRWTRYTRTSTMRILSATRLWFTFWETDSSGGWHGRQALVAFLRTGRIQPSTYTGKVCVHSLVRTNSQACDGQLLKRWQPTCSPLPCRP